MSGWEPQLVGTTVTPPPHILDLLEPWFDADLPAVSDQEATWTYRELAERSAALARALHEHGMRAGDCVVIHALMSRWAVVGMLGALRAGLRYVAVDAAFPVTRQRLIAAAAGARLAVVEPGLPLGLEGLPRLELEQVTQPAAASLPGSGTTVRAPGAAPPALRAEAAYTCFTSGSTGVPKGVSVSAAALAYSTAARLVYYQEPVRAYLLCSSISFDSSVAGIYWTLAAGGHLVIPASRPADLVAVRRAARRWPPSHLLMVPGLYRAALRGGLAAELESLSTAIVAGEPCPPALVGEHLAALPRTRLYNEYGPTECTVWCTVHACGPADANRPSVPIGVPIPGARLYVRDSAGGPTRPGQVGELYVGGPGVARPSTPEADPDDSPFRRIGDEWLYRTGDLVAVDPDGLLTFHGRVDDQLKLGGVRVERVEIEQVLAEAARVPVAVGVATAGVHPRVVGFLVTDAIPNVSRIRASMLTRLPAAALPARFEAVSTLPMLPNGKVDHGELDRRAASVLAI